MTKAILVGILSASTLLVGCSSEDEVAENPIPESGALEIKGNWSSNFGSTDTIDDDSWTSVYPPIGEGGAGGDSGEPTTIVQRIDSFSNKDNEIVTQNAEDAEDSPGLYNRTLWTEIEGNSFYFCTTDFNMATAADARARNTYADPSDPENSGCGAFSWTKLTRD